MKASGIAGSKLIAFWSETSAQDLTEYALLLGGIALVMLGAVAELEDAIRNLWTTMDSRLQTPGA